MLFVGGCTLAFFVSLLMHAPAGVHFHMKVKDTENELAKDVSSAWGLVVGAETAAFLLGLLTLVIWVLLSFI